MVILQLLCHFILLFKNNLLRIYVATANGELVYFANFIGGKDYR
jgi:rRNA pseudouridine-1189 N-methylase Emg1 (Nep1/Mra1 family)